MRPANNNNFLDFPLFNCVYLLLEALPPEEVIGEHNFLGLVFQAGEPLIELRVQVLFAPMADHNRFRFELHCGFRLGDDFELAGSAATAAFLQLDLDFFPDRCCNDIARGHHLH